MYGQKIMSIRLARGYTQEYVAAKVGIGQQEYSRIEKDQRQNITDELLDKIANTLGVSKEDIKSPTPIIMHFHNSPNSGQISYSNFNDSEIIKILQKQIEEKDKQIAELLAVLRK